MTNRNIKEITVSVVLIALLCLLANPFHIWMPSMVHMTIVALALGAFGLFASLIMKERANDEREGAHRMYAGRVAFLTGSIVLITGIITQSLTHSIDIWLPGTLIVMILSKIAARVWSDRNS